MVTRTCICCGCDMEIYRSGFHWNAWCRKCESRYIYSCSPSDADGRGGVLAAYSKNVGSYIDVPLGTILILNDRPENKEVFMNMNPICPYCQKESELVTGKEIYLHRTDLHSKAFYRCKDCDAYVGCHPGTTKPLGRLADAELRKAKLNAHAAFDPMWQGGKMARKLAYAWLARALKIPVDKCHIGEFDVEMCERVKFVCVMKQTTEQYCESNTGWHTW